MADAPVIAAVLTTYNRPEQLRRALRGVLAQRGFDEVIVVDDASDRPAEADAADPRLRVLRHEQNRGVSAARNTGWQSARATHLVFVDDDDRLMPFAARAFRMWSARSGPERIVVGGLLVDRPGRLPSLRRPPSSRPGEIWGLDRHLLKDGGDFATKQAALIPRALLERTGGWDEALTSRETSELFFRLSEVAAVDARTWPVYRLNRGDHMRLTKDRERRLRSVDYIRQKHAALLSDPARRAAFEDNHRMMMEATAEMTTRAAT